TITNTGKADLHIASFTSRGTDAAQFAATASTCILSSTM
ncbi:MAG: hypothetical protein RLZZ516_310, partial [Cyanobacteriota bacterium]